MTEEWEYIEEAIAIQSQKDYLKSCPALCRTCRWLDTYYEMGCTQQAYPDAKGKCVLYTHHANYRRFRWFGKDLNYLFWQVKVWFFEKVLRQKRNQVGSWKQWEYGESWEDDEEELYDGYGNYWEPDYEPEEDEEQ